jgi:hypothetical protein
MYGSKRCEKGEVTLHALHNFSSQQGKKVIVCLLIPIKYPRYLDPNLSLRVLFLCAKIANPASNSTNTDTNTLFHFRFRFLDLPILTTHPITFHSRNEKTLPSPFPNPSKNSFPNEREIIVFCHILVGKKKTDMIAQVTSFPSVSASFLGRYNNNNNNNNNTQIVLPSQLLIDQP